MQSGNLAVFVGEDEEVAVVGFPRVVAGIFHRGGVAIAHGRDSSEEVGLAGKRHKLLMLDGLKNQSGVASVLVDLLLGASLRGIADDDESDAGEAHGEQHERQNEFGTELARLPAPPKKLRDSSRESAAVPSTDKVHEAARVATGTRSREWTGSTI